MADVAVLREEGGEFVLTYAPLDLVIRGSHPEWVLAAAAEIVGGAGRIGSDARVAAAESRAPDGDPAAIARFELRERFARMPTCTVRHGDTAFRWVAAIPHG